MNFYVMALEEMSKSMLEVMKELNNKMKEPVENMKERWQNEQDTPKPTDDGSGEGLI